MSANNFTPEQTAELEKLFEKFYDLSQKIILTAKTTKMAIGFQEYSNQKLDYSDIELAFENIIEDMQFIRGESAELSAIPDYLFWKNRNTYDLKTIY